MSKILKLTAAALVFAGSAYAGNVVFEAPVEEEVVVEDAPMGSSNAAWVVPLIALAAIALVVSNDDDDDEES
jgi:hypothetical protein